MTEVVDVTDEALAAWREYVREKTGSREPADAIHTAELLEGETVVSTYTREQFLERWLDRKNRGLTPLPPAC